MTEAKPSNGNQHTIYICQGSGCVSGKAIEITEALAKAVAELGLEGIKIDFTGCHGFCERGPLVFIRPKNTFYQRVRVEDVPEIISETILSG